MEKSTVSRIEPQPEASPVVPRTPWGVKLARACGAFVCLLGIAVIAGWHFRLATMVHLREDLPHLQYNSALCFAFAGCALVLAAGGWRIIANVLGALVAVMGFLTFTQYIFYGDYGIDQLFVKPFVIVTSPHPGRMSPPSALGFSMVGTAIILAANRLGTRERLQLASVLSLATLGISLVASLGYAIGLEAAYGWRELNGMALHEAFGLIALSGGVFALAVAEGAKVEGHFPHWVPTPVGMGLLAATLVLWRALANSNQFRGFLPEVTLVFGIAIAGIVTLMISYGQLSAYRERLLNTTNRDLQNAQAERQEIGHALRETMALHTALLDHSPSAIIATNANGVITMFNVAAERMLGMKSDEVIGKLSPAVFCDSEEVAQRAKQLSQELSMTVPPGFEAVVSRSRRNLSNQHEWTWITREQRRVRVLLNVVALRDLDGMISGFLAIATDITERRRNDDEVKRLQQTISELTQAVLKPEPRRMG